MSIAAALFSDSQSRVFRWLFGQPDREFHLSELRRLTGKTRERGLTLIPLRVYLKRGRIKAEIALAKGKKEYDKRETIRRREAEMEAKQAVRASKAQRQ